MLIRSTIAAVALLAVALPASARELSAADQALRARAIAACNSPQYPNGARPHINYGGGWFRCVPISDGGRR